MFNDRYGLTEAVLSGRKTQTRRIVKVDVPLGNWSETMKHSRYKVGEVVAVAQSYKDIVERIAKKGYDAAKWMDEHRITKNLAGWSNKMFVKASLMIFKIRITNVRVERLQDISDDDILAEGISTYIDAFTNIRYFTFGNAPNDYTNHSSAFRVLIDKVSGKGTWDSNPWVFVYDFELVK